MRELRLRRPMMDIEALPINAVLYPNIARRGGLAQALVEEAREQEVDLGAVDAHGYHRHWTASIQSSRGAVRVSMVADRHAFSITIATESHRWAGGTTGNLSDAVHVADAWRKGATLGQLHKRFPFMTFDRMAQAYEDGNPIEIAWKRLLHGESSSRMRPLLRAAHANERLRRLVVSVSHNNLAIFSVNPEDKNAEEVRIMLTPDGTYHVGSVQDDSHRTATSIDEAIEAAVALLF